MQYLDFTCKPFLEFKYFHIELNKYIKLSTSAIDYLFNSTKKKDELNNLIETLIINAGERWGKTKYADPFNELSKIRSQLTQSAIMWVFSSFEIFLNLVHGTYSDSIVNPERQERVDTNESIRLSDLFRKFDWDIQEIVYLKPVFDFYSLSRHCIVHNMGKANQELIDIANSKDFLDAIENWPTVVPKMKLSPPPDITVDGIINFRPHHAITYSDVCFRVVKVVNENIYRTVGLKYFVSRVAKDTILDKPHLLEPKCRDLYAYLKFNLRKDYNLIKDINPTVLKNILEEIGNRKDCVRKYNSLRLQEYR